MTINELAAAIVGATKQLEKTSAQLVLQEEQRAEVMERLVHIIDELKNLAEKCVVGKSDE